MTVWDGKTIICASKWMNVVEKFRILLDDYDRTGFKPMGLWIWVQHCQGYDTPGISRHLLVSRSGGPQYTS
jgi:hypothetical protein